jgi:myo-inositol 2-dehydrogenase / D-chiro-inositol 1-dehydrogenase
MHVTHALLIPSEAIMIPTRAISRRRFLGGTVASAVGAATPWIVPARVLANAAPSNTLRLGCIGTGRMGHGDMLECIAQGLTTSGRARVVAVCDVDRQRVRHARQTAEEAYAKRLSENRPPQIEVFDDYRELLAREDIDGVTIATPDHWHALVAIAAADAGKDVYLQKPLTYTIVEGQRLIKAVRQNRVILQVGSQQRSSPEFRRACELVRNGRIGKLHTIEVRLPADRGVGDATTMAVPHEFDFDRWLGPASNAPYTQDRVHPQRGFGRPGWLQLESYSRGMITGWGSHMFDIAQWGHGSDDSGLVEIAATAEFPERGLFDVHTKFHAEGQYADGVRLIATTGEPAGVKFRGDLGWIDVGRSSLQAEPRSVLAERLGNGEVRLERCDNHMLNFLQSMRSRQDPICPVEVGHRSNSICVMAHIAMKLGRKLRWDPHAERFLDDESASGMLDYAHREPWTIERAEGDS